jgi:hypothetical protein
MDMRRHLNPSLAAALLWGLSALAGCGHSHDGQTPNDGVLTVRIDPTPTAVAGLTLTSGTLHIEGLTVLGDVAPDGRAMVSEFNLDLMSTGASFTLSMLPQGLYSRVRFGIDHASVAGSWRGAPLVVQLEGEGDGGGGSGGVDVRSSGVEVEPGHDAELTVAVDDAGWFANNLLDSAVPDNNGQITVDGLHNLTVAATLWSRITGSFSLADTTPVQ